MKRILITGGLGFLGRHFTSYFMERGDEVVIVDDLSSGVHPAEWASFLKYDKKLVDLRLMDVREYLKIAEKEQFDLAIHLAAVVKGREAIEGKPVLSILSMELDSAFFRWCVKARPKQIIYMSSSAAYPTVLQEQADVQTKLKEEFLDFSRGAVYMPDYGYGWAKLAGEFQASLIADKYNLNIHCPRPFSGYGADQDMCYPIPAICKRVIDKETPITIWGSGNQSRDFIYVDDLINAIMAYMPSSRGYTVMNYGSGVGVTFKEVATIASKILGRNIQIKCLKDKPEGVFYRVGDNTKMLSYFRPTISFKEGLAKVVAYLQLK